MTPLTPIPHLRDAPFALGGFEGGADSSFLRALHTVLGREARAPSRAHEAAVSADRDLLREGSAPAPDDETAETSEVAEAPPIAPTEAHPEAAIAASTTQRPSGRTRSPTTPAVEAGRRSPASSRDPGAQIGVPGTTAPPTRAPPAAPPPAAPALFAVGAANKPAAAPRAITPLASVRTAARTHATAKASSSEAPRAGREFDGVMRTIQESLEASVRVRSGDERWVVQVHLDPPELGSVRIQVEMRGSALSGTLEVEDPELHEALDDLLGELERGLQDGGREAQLRLAPRAGQGGGSDGVDAPFEEAPGSSHDLPDSDHLLDLMA